MKITEKIIAYLISEPRFRERRGKDRGLVNLLVEEYPQLKEISKETIVAICQDYASLDRIWRQTLKARADLRGADYDDKAPLETEKMAELGYANLCGEIAENRIGQTLL